MKNLPLLLYIATSVIVGFIAGWVVFGDGADRNIWLVDSAKQIRSGEGRYTNPLLECDVAQGAINATKISFQGELAKFVGGINGSIGVSDVAVYFRDLNNGPAFGVKQDDLFIPASLLKVPVMMAYFKAAEKTPEILSSNISVPTDILSVDIPQLEPPEKRIEVGKQYTVEELITRMIVYSDNQSLISLFEKMPGEELMNLYKLLGVDSAVISDPTASISVRQYSAFFRILFNSSFLSQNYSEKALGILTESAFEKGLRSGVPNEVPIAHKFGEREIQGALQLHDCGIVYYPKHPYLLCIMTRGTDFTKLQNAISSISSFVYSEVDSQHH